MIGSLIDLICISDSSGCVSPLTAEDGNMDCKELVAGSTLYLPISVPLALFSVGYGHTAQGDGEVSSTAIECPMERVVLQFDLKVMLLY